MIDYSNIRKGNHCIIWTRVSSKYQEDNGGSLCEKAYRGRYGLDFGIRPLFKNRLAGYKDAGGYAYFRHHCDCREIRYGHKDKRGDDDGSTDAFDGTVGQSESHR